MTRARPAAGCRDVAFPAGYAMDDAAEVALEDYARALCRAGAAEAVRAEGGTGAVTGIHLCGVEVEPASAVLTDIDHFARDLAEGGTGGLGWS